MPVKRTSCRCRHNRQANECGQTRFLPINRKLKVQDLFWSIKENRLISIDTTKILYTAHTHRKKSQSIVQRKRINLNWQQKRLTTADFVFNRFVAMVRRSHSLDLETCTWWFFSSHFAFFLFHWTGAVECTRVCVWKWIRKSVFSKLIRNVSECVSFGNERVLRTTCFLFLANLW